MKSADIKVGEEYAVGSGYQAKDRGNGRNLRRAKVEEKGAQRRYYPEWSIRGQLKNDGIRVRLLVNETGEPLVREGEEKVSVLSAREVVQPWEEYVVEEAANKERREVAAAERAKANRAADAALTSILETIDIDFHDLPYWMRPSASYRKQELADLLDKAYEAGALAEAPWKA